MRGLFRFWAVLLVASFGLATIASADVVPPEGWPDTPLTRPRFEAWPNAIRVFGDNRYQTGLASSLMLRGSGDPEAYPYGNPDPATPKGWWGLDSCPRSIIVVAGDNPADALAASSLSDATGQSTEPFLQRSAAADPLFYPPGGFARVDTDFAPILVTTSARQGATQLDISTRLAAQDFRSGGCDAARQAIIVGGSRAVASTVDSELVSIGYDEVFRVGGANRYATSRLIAESLGTAASDEADCLDERTNDGDALTQFYANAVVEWRASSTSCELLRRTVVLTDGIDGIDALAAGWWTSFWQVPILLHDGSRELPRQTIEALQTLDIENLVVLGGTQRISEEVARDAVTYSGAAGFRRVEGADRYATSVAMAKIFGGWWPTRDAQNFRGSIACIAASSGSTASGSGVGWADALTSGPWCGRASATASRSPDRALTPYNGIGPGTTGGEGSDERGRSFVPILLVPARSSVAPEVVQIFLRDSFSPATSFCSGDHSTDCAVPGFAVIFGGPGVLDGALVGSLSGLVGAGHLGSETIPVPVVGSGFFTRLSMRPVFDDPIAAESLADARLCFGRGAISGVRWLGAEGVVSSVKDLVNGRNFARDADRTVRSSGLSTPLCVAVSPDVEGSAQVWGTSPTGVRTRTNGQLAIDPTHYFSLATAISMTDPTGTRGESSSTIGPAGTSNWTFTLDDADIRARWGEASVDLTSVEVRLSLVRGSGVAGSTLNRVSGEFRLSGSGQLITGRLRGEAIFDVDRWRVAGVAEFDGEVGGVAPPGGFRAEILLGAGAESTDDRLVWKLDGLV